MTNWEYKLEINLGDDGKEGPEKALNDLGADGWELVSATQVTTKTGQHNLAFFFKRPAD